ncbi:hypothetical protein SNE40_023395 [Patella caerulea]|uniref:F-box domain-containing protein n=1 Tax=Patella caerulea TaxID=87958 RepID=A0AAN8J0C2_PATCE
MSELHVAEKKLILDMESLSTTGSSPWQSLTQDYLKLLSLEIICKILECLPLQDVLKMSCQCKKMQQAVTMYLKTLKSINFTEGMLEGWMPSTISDDDLYCLIPRCNELRFIYGFHPIYISERRQRGKNKQGLSIPGVLSALNLAPKLKGIEISNIFLLSAILNYFPDMKIIGTFKNRIEPIPLESSRLNLTANPRVTSLHLTGIVISELPKMESVVYLYLRMVKITHPDPFRDFLVPNLHTFVMSNCSGPQNTLSYVQMLAALATAKPMSRLEMVKVPFLGGLLQHVVEDSWKSQGFRMLTTIIFGGCKNALELDLGYLLITAANRLKELSVQPSLTKDSLFSAIKMADVEFNNFRSLYLGYVDPITESGESVILEDLNGPPESPAMITDNGMKAIGQTFLYITQLEIYNCPHLLQPSTWFTSGVETWAYLQHLTLRRCHAVRLPDFRTWISNLPRLETLHLEFMFREPPKGCARVGLSAGTGLGVSSAFVQNNGNGIVQNPAGGDLGNDEDNNDGVDNNNDENEINRAANGNAEHINLHPDVIPNPNVPVQPSNEIEDNDQLIPANERNDNGNANLNTFDELYAHLIKEEADQDDDKNSPSVSHVKGDNSEEQNEAYEFSQPGCSHWNENECHSPKRKVCKTVKVSNVKSSSKIHSPESRRPTKSVKIISVKCRSPSPPKPKSSDSIVSSGDASGPSSSCRSQDTPFSVQNSAGDAPSYLFSKPPPKYSASHANNTNDNSSSRGIELTNVPPPEYSDENNLCANPGKYDPNNSFSDNLNTNPNTMDISPPDYNTAMAQGNVLSMPCSCQISNEPSESQSGLSSDLNTPAEGACSSTNDTAVQNKTTRPAESATNEQSIHDNKDGSNSSENKLNVQKGKSLLGKKKGLMKRKLNLAPDVAVDSSTCNKSCQAVSEDIREATLKAQEDFEAEKKKSGTSNKSQSTRRSLRLQRTVHPKIVLEDELRKKVKPTQNRSTVKMRRKHNMHHKATSTSDPVKEDDHIQVLILRSNSLVNVYLHMVGITDLIVDECPNLTFITGSACRVLKKVTIYSAPKLSKTSFHQCPKLDQTHLVNEVCDQISEKNRSIFLRPMYQFDERDFESMLFHQPDIGYHLCIVYDYSSCPNQTLYNRIRVSNWLDLFSGMNPDLVRTMDFTETSWYRVDAYRYPWKRDIYRLQGNNDNGSKWQIMTDIPWLRMLSQCPDLYDPRQLLDDRKDGIYCPAAKGHYTVENCLDDLTYDLAEYKAANQMFFCNCIVVYFNMCDTSGIPAPDLYT